MTEEKHNKDFQDSLKCLPTDSGPEFSRAARLLAELLDSANVCASHGLKHALDVARLIERALACCPQPLSNGEKLERQLAALLHDADDRKLFPAHKDYQNAQTVLRAIGLDAAAEGRVIEMISWVSTSANGDRIPPAAEQDPSLLYARWADRLAAMGWTGAWRCWKYTLGVQRPLFTADTPRAFDENDLWARVATPERYAAYRGDSASMIDHYYDKLLHVGRFVTDNPFLIAEARRRSRPLVDIALIFGRTGTLPEGLYDKVAAEAEKESADSAHNPMQSNTTLQLSAGDF